MITGLEQDQPVRRVMDPDSAEKIDAFIQLLTETKNLNTPFTIVNLVIVSVCFA